jgi:HD-like signal output (HDOD) protein
VTEQQTKTCNNCKRVYKNQEDFLKDTNRWRLCDMGNLWFNCNCKSTLMLKKGKFDWYTPEKFFSEDANSVFNKLGGLKDLPHIPNSVMELQNLLADDKVSAKQLAIEVKKEPFIAAAVMQVAENLRASRSPDNKPISALEHSIVYIGTKALSDIVVAAALRSFEIPESDFDSDAFWTESYVMGAVAEFLMQRYKVKENPDRVYLAASLCNIGKLVTAICYPDQASKVNRAVNSVDELTTWRSVEVKYGFPDHAILGEISASMWGLPEYVVDAARYHHRPPNLDPNEAMTLSELVGLSVQLTHWVLLQPHRIEEGLLEAYKRKLRLDDKMTEDLAGEITEVRRRIKTEVNISG